VLGTGGYFLLRSRHTSVAPSNPSTPVTGTVTKPAETPTTTQVTDPAQSAPLQPPTPLSVPPEAAHPTPGETSPEETATAKKATPRPETSRTAKVHVSILVRPYGAIQVDNEAPSPQPLAQHDLHLAPGRHTITVRCEWCEDAEETIEVASGAENVFRLRAQLKPSRLSFDYQPADAQVRVGKDSRSARETQEHPFDIQSPRGPASFQHRVEYEVSYPGYRTEKRLVLVEPGKPVTLRGSLVAE
jgi:serine/threonine-protein kinase